MINECLCLNEYQELSRRTFPLYDPQADRLSNYALGLTGEAGEVADIIKKYRYHGHKLEVSEIEKELGDVLHYLAGLADFVGLRLSDVAKANLEKLEKRYPEGFSEEASRNRTE